MIFSYKRIKNNYNIFYTLDFIIMQCIRMGGKTLYHGKFEKINKPRPYKFALCLGALNS